MAAIFISHSSEDGAQALALKEMLTKIGFDNVFLDSDKDRGIPLGSDWEKTLYRELDHCHAVLLVLTKNWLGSKWCFAEFAQARALGKTIYVVLENPAGERGEIAKDIQVCDLVANREVGLRQLHAELERSLLVPQVGFEFDAKTRAPYPGLNAFEEKDAGVFFGRDQEISAVFERVKSERGRAKKALVLLGGSGTGKSSLLKAGALPRLRRERDVDGRPTHLLALQRPGEAPLRALLEALRSLDPTLTLADLSAATNPRAARALIDRLRTRAGAPQAILVLAIDQAEEMFASDPDERKPFQDLLGALIAGDNPARLILSMRGDHIEALQRIAGLTDALELHAVKPMPMERLGEIVKSPARRANIDVEDELVEAIRADAATEDALPLVAFVLRELYERYGRKSRRLEKAHYDAMRVDELSPLESAVRRKAEETIAGASEDELAALREAFVPGLVRLDEDSGVFTRRDARPGDLPQMARGLIERLIGARLLVQRAAADGAHVEVAHEALFRVWPKLAGWLAADRDLLVRFQGVQRAAKEWGANARQEAWLAHRGPRLAEAEALGQRSDIAAKFDPLDRAYLVECRAGEDAASAAEELRRREREAEQAQRLKDAQDLAAANRRRAQAISLGLVVALALAVLAAWFAYNAQAQKVIAEQQKSEAQNDQGAALAALSSLALPKSPTNAAKLALSAWPKSAQDSFPRLAAALDALSAATRQLRERRVFKGHSDTVTSASFSPDGTRIVTSSNDKTARLWDVATGRQISILIGHTEAVKRAAFSPDGSRVVTASWDATARIWNLATGGQIAVLTGHTDAVWSAIFSSDGARVLTCSADDTARIWDATTGKPLAVLAGHEQGVNTAVFSPDGSKVVTASLDNTARLWDAATGQQIVVFSGHTAPVASAAFSPDGTRVVTASWDGSARLWDAATGQQVAVFNGHTDKVWSAAFSPDGAQVVTGSWDATARVWDVATGKQVAIFDNHIGAVQVAVFSPDGTVVATTSEDGAVRVWNVAMGKEVAVLRGHAKSALTAAFSPDGAYVVTASSDGTARLWDATTEEQVSTLVGHTGFITGVAYSRDGTQVVTASSDGTARLWSATSGLDVAVFRGHKGTVASVALSPDGARVVTASWDATARLWDAASGKELAVLAGHTNWVNGAAFAPDGARVVTASSDGTARIWDVASGRQITLLRGDAGLLGSAAFSPDGTRVVTASSDGTARIWDAETGLQIVALRGRAEPLVGAVFSPDGRRIVTASLDGSARIWDVASAKEMAELKGHTKTVNTAEFSPDGARVVTASLDGTARVWDAATGAEIVELGQRVGPVSRAALSPDGVHVVTVADDFVARVWRMRRTPGGDLFAIACAWLPDEGLAEIVQGYGLKNLEPICEGNPPLPDEISNP